MTVFDIPAARIADLDDADLRELVARLCEAERERYGGHRTEVSWGGAQTTPDGGIDVMVQLATDFVPNPVLPRSVVGFQVKKSDLRQGAVLAEMCPGGSLRRSIEDIARNSGAYLIVSVGVDCSRTMLEDRRNAMRQALGGHPDLAVLHTDFIDRHALARWVSAHPAVSLWLRERLGLPSFRGWVGYSQWSSTPKGVDDTLICGDGLSFTLPGPKIFNAVPDALEAIRALVRDSKKAIRIAGLSGIGKTRLAQALFEETSVGNPIPQSWAVYTDIGRDPEPPPLQMLETLISLDRPAVLIVDNCPPDSHRALADRLAKSDTRVSVITIEYDVRDDRPEETEVIRIEAEGSDIVEALIRRRHPGRSPSDARRLAELAIGNARLALALAAAAPATGSLSAFDDDALFRRLFWQREQPDPQLEQSAEALSLVYSFDVEGVEDPDELLFLSELTAIPRLLLYRHANTLVERGLAQVRGRWRAVLPHALANRLARRAIHNLPWRELGIAFSTPGAARLRRSFARRLAYLHDVQAVRQIVELWMQPNGPLDSAQGITGYDLDLLERLCHLVPAEALNHLRLLAGQLSGERHSTRGIDQITRLLARVSHSPDHFDRAVEGLVDLAISSEERDAANADRAIESLFGLYLSGTLARTDQRIDVARRTAFSPDPKVAKRGLAMLRAALKTSMWSSAFFSTEDARPEAFGWHPRGHEVVEWFRGWMALGEECALGSHDEVKKEARDILAQGCASIWRRVPSLRDDIEKTAARMSSTEPWVEGWNALRRMRSLEIRRSTDHESVELERLSALIREMEPLDLIDRARAILRSEGYLGDEPDGEGDRDFAAVMQRHSAKLREIGEELAERPDIIDALADDLFAARHNNPFELGRGLGSVTSDPPGQWSKLRDLYLSALGPRSRPSVLSGFLAGIEERVPDIANEIRDECLRTPALRQTYAAFAPGGEVSNAELHRLTVAASDPNVWAGQFSGFVWSDQHGLNDADRVRLLTAMQTGQYGLEAIIDALAMLRHNEEKSPSDWPPELRGVGINTVALMLTRGDDRLNSNLDFHAAEVVQKCLVPRDEVGARRLVDAMVAHARRRYGSLYDVERTVAALAERAPFVFLDRALGASDPRLRLSRDSTFEKSPLGGIEPQLLIDWCRMGGAERWISVADAIQPFGPDDTSEADSHTTGLSSQAKLLLATAPDPEAVVAVFFGHVSPMSWSGSRADIMERRLLAMEQLASHPNERVRQAFDQGALGLRQIIARERERERAEDRERDVSFE